ncbi:MAG: hypothetical protein DWQ07_26020 [Chloroflexi bacterium]|nr:MAG: hypothetical protein DWQ07_26020 [Chloroflexota bacterium]
MYTQTIDQIEYVYQKYIEGMVFVSIWKDNHTLEYFGRYQWGDELITTSRHLDDYSALKEAAEDIRYRLEWGE